MRTATCIAAFVLLFAVAIPAARQAAAQDTIVMDGDADIGMVGEPGACGCRQSQSPPWHGSVSGDPCGPSCPPPTMFHANPCGQLWMKHTARQQGLCPPPCFPRMHGWLTDGSWPTPRPIALPRCPRCGAHIEGGF